MLEINSITYTVCQLFNQYKTKLLVKYFLIFSRMNWRYPLSHVNIIFIFFSIFSNTN